MTSVGDLDHRAAANSCGLPALEGWGPQLKSFVASRCDCLVGPQCTNTQRVLHGSHTTYCRVVEEKRKKLNELKAVLDNGVDSEAGLQRLRGSEGRLRADIAAVQALNLQQHKKLMESSDNEYRKMQQLKDQALKRTRKRDEQETKAARLQAKLETVQARRQRPCHLGHSACANLLCVLHNRQTQSNMFHMPAFRCCTLSLCASACVTAKLGSM